MGWISAAIGAVGGITSTILGNNSARKEAEKNREWQEQMSNTSISRRMADLRNAGLNPLLAVDNASSGASTPSGSQAQIERFDPSWLTALSSAKVANAQAKQIEEQTKGIKQENSIFDVKADKLRTEAELQRQGILTAKTVQELNKANTLESKARILINQAQRENIKMSTEEAKRKIQLLDLDVDFYNKNPGMKRVEKMANVTSSPTGTLGAINGMLLNVEEGLTNSAKRIWYNFKNKRSKK